jgi:RNA polymerase sigma-70 factor (ECF subfamily)
MRERAPSAERVAQARGSVHLESDAVSAIRSGDAAAFAQVFNEFYNRLCVYTRSYVRDFTAAEEIVEDLFVWIWENRAGWEVHTSLRQYLYTSVRNRALKHLRHERVRRRVHDTATRAAVPPGMAGPALAPDEELELRELAALVDRTVGGLPDRCREAFQLSRGHGLTHAEIAEVMGISVSTVEKHIVRATSTLRDAIAVRSG